MTTKSLRYIQIRENAVRESIKTGTIDIKHIGGKTNPSDIFTKKDRDINHFIQCRDTLCSAPPAHYTSATQINTTHCTDLSSRALLEGGCWTSVPLAVTLAQHGA